MSTGTVGLMQSIANIGLPSAVVAISRSSTIVATAPQVQADEALDAFPKCWLDERHRRRVICAVVTVSLVHVLWFFTSPLVYMLVDQRLHLTDEDVAIQPAWLERPPVSVRHRHTALVSWFRDSFKKLRYVWPECLSNIARLSGGWYRLSWSR
jgi:hypothetical protein